MKIFISDTNILIDLIKLDLESIFFDLPDTKFLTTDFVYKEINHEQSKMLHPFIQSGKLEILISAPSDFAQIAAMFNKTTGLSLVDCSVCYFTIKYKGILLTGDKMLRKYSESNKIEVRGILYLFDEFLRHEIIDFTSAIERLTHLRTLNSRLPSDGIKLRLESWSVGKYFHT